MKRGSWGDCGDELLVFKGKIMSIYEILNNSRVMWFIWVIVWGIISFIWIIYTIKAQNKDSINKEKLERYKELSKILIKLKLDFETIKYEIEESMDYWYWCEEDYEKLNEDLNKVRTDFYNNIFPLLFLFNTKLNNLIWELYEETFIFYYKKEEYIKRYNFEEKIDEILTLLSKEIWVNIKLKIKHPNDIEKLRKEKYKYEDEYMDFLAEEQKI